LVWRSEVRRKWVERRREAEEGEDGEVGAMGEEDEALERVDRGDEGEGETLTLICSFSSIMASSKNERYFVRLSRSVLCGETGESSSMERYGEGRDGR